ncbi:unnamed protein product [Rotaria socialis]|uniref:Uncharacterized protein n=1 Tax=Rotaria socialis TaxID=392032 RepID=A0A822A4Q9_9BILA|nr:unnamed protein product [Rotaria socialis]CAF4989737.1 unnamed protein product [Rotaria socialis]
MKIYWHLISFILCYYLEAFQPYFPPQIVFSLDTSETIIAIEEINQPTNQSISVSPSNTQISYALKQFPYANPDSPQSKYYVELVTDPLMNTYIAEIHISLSTSPHRIDGNDSVRVQWNATQCTDCFTLSPKEFSFNMKSFQEKQILKIPRVKDAPQSTIIPIFYGGGFDLISPQQFPIYIQ